ARVVLALAGRKLARAQRLGRRLGPLAVARLLWLHRHALRAELGGRLAEANFWWSEVREQWRRLPPDHPCWHELTSYLAQAGAAALAADAAGLRARLARELLLDTHLAFWNNLLVEGDPLEQPERAAWHLRRAQELAENADLPPDQAEDFEQRLQLLRL